MMDCSGWSTKFFSNYFSSFLERSLHRNRVTRISRFNVNNYRRRGSRVLENITLFKRNVIFSMTNRVYKSFKYVQIWSFTMVLKVIEFPRAVIVILWLQKIGYIRLRSDRNRKMTFHSKSTPFAWKRWRKLWTVHRVNCTFVSEDDAKASEFRFLSRLVLNKRDNGNANECEMYFHNQRIFQ